MRIVLFLSLFLLPLCALGYTSVLAVPADETVVLSIDTPETAQEYFGALRAFPHTFTFDVAEELKFSANLFALSAVTPKNDLSMLLVKIEERGVSDVVRTNPKESSWESNFDASIGTARKDAGVLQATLAPGSYILEVSSPSNDSFYQLMIGESAEKLGYAASVQRLFEVQSLLPGLPFGVFLSPLIYVPVLLFLMTVFLIFFRRSKK